MADIKTLTLPDNNTYNIKDASALATLSISGRVITGTTRGGNTVSVTLPADVDEKVKATSTTSNSKYPLMAVATSSPSSGTAYLAIYNTGITINPNYRSLSAGVGTISATDTGALSHGYASGSDSYISAGGSGATAFGYAADTGSYIEASGSGALAFGGVYSNAYVAADSAGSLAFGNTDADGAYILTGDEGAFAGGSTNTGNSYIKASGKGSFAFGEIAGEKGHNHRIHANNGGAIAMGFVEKSGIYSNGRGSAAIGMSTYADNDGMMAVGKYNDYDDEDTLFVVGNGTLNDDGGGSYSITRSNAFKVLKTGIAIAPNGFFQTSDKRKKNIISDISLDKVYNLIDKCQTIIYTLKDDPTNKEQIGMIAQEIQEFFPEVVSEDSNGVLSLDYARLTVIIFKVLKDFIKRINVIEQKLN